MTMLAPTNHYRTSRKNTTQQVRKLHAYTIKDALDHSGQFSLHFGKFGPIQQFVWPRIATRLHCNLQAILKISTEPGFPQI